MLNKLSKRAGVVSANICPAIAGAQPGRTTQRRSEERTLYKGSSAHKVQAESGNNRAHANIGEIARACQEILPGCTRKVRSVNQAGSIIVRQKARWLTPHRRFALDPRRVQSAWLQVVPKSQINFSIVTCKPDLFQVISSVPVTATC